MSGPFLLRNSVQLYMLLLLLLYVERLYELMVSRRNSRRTLAAGAVETGQRQFRPMAVFHALFPLCCGLEVIFLQRLFPGVLGWAALAVAVAAQALRWWVIATLGETWSVRIIVRPDQRLVTGGPYRYLRHPNYLAVILEILAVPLIHGAWWTAAIGTAINAALLRVRIRTEERALGPRHAAAFAERARLVPGVGRVRH